MMSFIRIKLQELIDERIRDALSMSALDVAIDIVTGNQIEGDYLEFGVYTGKSFIRAYKRFKEKRRSYNLANKMRYFAFDSFKGLPASNDVNKPTQYEKGAYLASQELFIKKLEEKGVDLSEVVIINKWYGELSDQLKIKQHLKAACVIYLDCDLYQSTRDALKFVSDLVQDGTIIVLDDYYRHRCSPNAGVRKAWKEFLDSNPNWQATMVHNFRRVAFALNISSEQGDLDE